MKTRNYILLFALTTSVLALSFALPGILARVQDYLISEQTGDRSIQEVRMNFAKPTESTIDLLEFSSSKLDSMSNFEVYRLDPSFYEGEMSKKQNVALDTLRFLENEGIDFLAPDQYVIDNMTPYMVKKDNFEEARLIWHCFISDESRNVSIVLAIDNDSEKLLAFEVNCQDNMSITPQTWANALSNYYGFVQGDYTGLGMIRFTDTGGRTIECPFRFSESSCYFNNGAL